MPEESPARISLGTSRIMVSPLGIGTNTWGSFGKADPGMQDTFAAALELGINFFDTAEVYQLHGSELTLGQFLPAAGDKAIAETKIFPYPWRLSAKRLIPTLRASLKRLKLDCVDVYMIHFPLPPVPIEAWMDEFAAAVELGLIRTVGVSNYSPDQMKRAAAALAKHGVRLAVNQVEYSLVRREPERNGLLALCKDMNVTLIAYRPLASGLLTGKYTPEHMPAPGRRSLTVSRADVTRVQPVVALLRQIGETHGGKTPGQVALNWLIAKGALPIPGAKNLAQMQSNAAALGWQLTQAEVAALDALS